MDASFKKIISGYRKFRQKYATGDQSTMEQLACHGQRPEIMVIACCDARVDPALILQCDPGDLFIVRNVANIVPPYESDEGHHGTSAALEFGICQLQVKRLIILGHSQCGGIGALLNDVGLTQNDFITHWMALIAHDVSAKDVDSVAQKALSHSYENCLTFPWIKARVMEKRLIIHRWFFDIESGMIFVYSPETQQYQPLSDTD